MPTEGVEAADPPLEQNRLSLTLFRRPEKYNVGEDFDLFVKKSNLENPLFCINASQKEEILARNTFLSVNSHLCQ